MWNITCQCLLLNTRFINWIQWNTLNSEGHSKIIVQEKHWHIQLNDAWDQKYHTKHVPYKQINFGGNWYQGNGIHGGSFANMIPQMESRINIRVHATTWQSLLPEMKALNATKHYITKHFQRHTKAVCLRVQRPVNHSSWKKETKVVVMYLECIHHITEPDSV